MGLPELSFKIIFCLFLAGLIGWIIGFLLGRIFGSANATQLLMDCEGKMRVREQELGALRSDLTTAQARHSSLETELATLATTLKTRDGWVTDLEEKNKELEADLDARISELDELIATSKQAKVELQTQLQDAVVGSDKALDALRARATEAEAALQSTQHEQGELRTLRLSFAAQEQELAQSLFRLKNLESLAGEVQKRDARLALLEPLTEQLQNREAEIAGLRVRVTELELMMREVKEPTVKVSQASSMTASQKERDDLKKIFGIGPVLEKLLNSHGIYWFYQIAKWSVEDVQRYDTLLEDFRGRIVRDDWITGAQQEQRKKYGEQV